MQKILVICFDTPFPTNYGGVYDIAAKFDFYKKNNFKIDLICSCFSKERLQEFEKYIAENETLIDHFHVELIQPNPIDFLSKIPFSVKTRKFPFQQIEFLKNEKYAFVLVEHLKSTYGLNDLVQLIGNQINIWLRIHNDETAYYRNLYQASLHLKRYFFLSESVKYKNYQDEILNHKSIKGFLFISQTEMEKLRPKIGKNKIQHLLPVYADIQIDAVENSKSIDFLYVGNLDLDDNLNALLKINSFLVQNQLLEFKLKIVGKCSGEKRKMKIRNLFSKIENVDFQFNVSESELKQNYENAKFFLNFSDNESGVKTKLIEAVSYGIPVISNREGVEGSNLESVVLNDQKIDVNWLKSALADAEIWKEYQNSYLKKVQNKLNWIHTKYEEFLNLNNL